MLSDIIFLLLIIAVFFILYGLYEYIDAGSIYNTFTVKNNILGYGKAEGIYLIATKNYYLVAGHKVRSKKKAIKEFFELINKNELLPAGMYFKLIKIAKGVTTEKEEEAGGIDFAESLIKHAQKEREKELEVRKAENIIKKESAEFTVRPLEQKKSVKVRR